MHKLTAFVVSATTALALGACAVPEDSGSSGAGSNGGDDSSSETKSSFTPAQNNAIRSAKSYLSMGTGFSRAGLIGQLSSEAGEGFKRKDAVFAVNHVKVDYRQEAVKSAKGYLDMSGMSRSGLIGQLTSKAGDQYTRQQAEFAANKVGLR